MLAVLAIPLLLPMALKLARTWQELRAARRGFITFGGDDRYQARNVHLDVHDAVMIARVRLSMPADEFEALIERVRRGYLPWYERLQAAIEHRPPAFESPLEIREEADDWQPGATPLLCKIIIYRQEQVVVLLGNHIYLGGYLLAQFVQLVFCKAVAKNVFPRNRYLPLLSELSMLAFFARLLLRRRHQPSPLYPDKSLVQRFYWKQELAPLRAHAAKLGMHVMYLVIAQQIFIVMERMKKSRLRVTLPVSFTDDHSFNTVGAMFFDVGREPDLDSMAKKIRRMVNRGRWQVSASNHIQRIFPTRKLSERARNVVDLTLTVVPQKTLPENLLTHQMQDYEFTMDNIQYPVYAMAFIFEDHVHSSFMVNTPAFDTAAFMQDGAAPTDLALASLPA